MGDNSRIGWTQYTWNWSVGCTHVSDGCDHCYAADLSSTRLAHTPTYGGLAVDGRFTGEVRVLEARLLQPLKLQRPRLIFVNSMSDWFHDGIPTRTIARAFAVMGLSRRHRYQGLTKRHGRMRSLLNSPGFLRLVAEEGTDIIGRTPGGSRQLELDGWRVVGHTPTGNLWEPEWPLPNVWVGVSVEDQKTADLRIPALVAQPFESFLSMEPLLGPVDLTEWLHERLTCGCGQAPPGAEGWSGGCSPSCMVPEPSPIGWVIVGGESGREKEGRRPIARMDPGWARDIVDVCQENRVPVFFKQYGAIAAGELGIRGKGASPDKWPTPWPQEMPAGMWNPEHALAGS